MGLAFFRKTSGPRLWNIASYHSPHSLTWRWILSFGLFRGDERRIWPIVMADRHNTGMHILVRIPWVGMFTFSTQRPMWFRDMWRQDRDERDGLTKRKADIPPAPAKRPTVVDGGNSLH
jgi:hypothetical protein